MTGNRAAAAAVVVRDSIDLTEKEEKILRRLLDVVGHFKMETQLRVAGGWVRDKLLGRECNDIDIALDNMLGREFCEKVNEYLSYASEKRQGFGVIQCKPDQSKHLETARMCIFDTWIDFVNLRSESYPKGSHVTIMCGTPEEDAFQRDLTINSMFYNINTKSVEDFTRKGIQDLKSGTIATPLLAKDTFLDDPLRVLRAIRFGARFGFALDEELKKAAAEEEVKTAIANKISRERIGHEIDLMVSGNQPVKAMTYICNLQLFWTVFTLPHNCESALMGGSDRLCVAHMDAAWNLLQSIGCLTFSDEQHRVYLYGSLLLPLRKVVYTDKNSKKIPVSSHIIRNSLKLRARDIHMVISLHGASERFISLITLLESSENSETIETELGDEYLDVSPYSRRRILAGLLLRQIKDFWRVALMMSFLLYPNPEQVEDFLTKRFNLNKGREMFRTVHDFILGLDLDKVWKMKPLLDGNTIMTLLQLETRGSQVRQWQQRLLKWQLAHPHGTAEEAVDWIKQSCAKPVNLN